MDFNLKNITESHIIIKLEKKQLEFRNAMEFRDSIFKMIEEGIENIDVDFDDINYIDSSGLGTLVSIVKKLKIKNGKLQLINVDKRIHNIFKISSLDKVIDIEIKED